MKQQENGEQYMKIFVALYSSPLVSSIGRFPTKAMRLRFDQEKKSLYSRLLVEPSVRNGASPTSATTMR
jgi:hypothetical protein